MITKKQFINFITEYQNFDKAIERLEVAISGKKYGCNLFESDWCESVTRMFNVFLESFFTDNGQDIVTWWLFEDVDHIIWQKTDPDLFNGSSEIEYNVNDIEDLWNYLFKYKKYYFL